MCRVPERFSTESFSFFKAQTLVDFSSSSRHTRATKLLLFVTYRTHR